MSLSSTYAAKVSGEIYTLPPNMTSTSSIGKKGAISKINSTTKFNGVSVSRITESVIDVFGSSVNISEDIQSSTQSNFAQINSLPIQTDLGNHFELEQSINKLQQVNTRQVATAIRNNQFDLLSGKFADGYPSNVIDTFATDTACTITRSIPGVLHTTVGKKLFKYNYSKKTG